LIELLVVVAIIGILAAMLFPALQGALTKAKATQVSNNGRQIYTLVSKESLDREALGRGAVWPTQDQYQTSTEFFKEAVSNWMKGVDFAFFGGAGLPEPDDPTKPSSFEAKHNAWCMTEDLSESSFSSTPFMFTRNFNLAKDSTLSTVSGLNRGTKPFGDKLGVVVTFGGSARILRSQEASNRYFNAADENRTFISP
jgi:type II secretory pathway pseudopilin PulG